ncbi:MAG: hypothetical protein LBQ77_06590, partial [Treponema sp.]|nr:hypothetical protein [Treponema sp.]
LTAGEAVDVGAEAATADVTFTGATDLTLAAADFAVTEGATISDVAVASDTVTVTITFSANTGETDVEYTVSINPDSEVIKGDAEATVTQAGTSG